MITKSNGFVKSLIHNFCGKNRFTLPMVQKNVHKRKNKKAAEKPPDEAEFKTQK